MLELTYGPQSPVSAMARDGWPGRPADRDRGPTEVGPRAWRSADRPAPPQPPPSLVPLVSVTAKATKKAETRAKAA
ncbi:hypothetical protein GCM10010238_51070 [Streptomyces griseoviridis]|uniref:Uncharacterized protein n=1 Tax=Streptomyces griseoviridis TaxID=45398 RepID=A0A918LJD4_STRGD|nr:hypothetical protein GCM10010238_51070 [Streptomyces niveoruber]